MTTDKVVVYRIGDRTVSAPVQVSSGIQHVNGVSIEAIKRKADWLEVYWTVSTTPAAKLVKINSNKVK